MASTSSPYRILVEDTREDIVVIHDDVTVRSSLSKFFALFGSTNPFASMMLPKVLVYSSKMMVVDGHSFGFCIVEYNPRLIDNGGVTGFVPWTHALVVLDYDKKVIVEFALMFSKTQLLSEFSHEFYVPNMDAEFLAPSEWLNKLFGISVPVFKIDREVKTSSKRFASHINSLRAQSIINFLTGSSLSVDVFTDPEEYDEKIGTYFGNGSIDIADIDEKVVEYNNNKLDFTDRIISYFENNQEKASTNEAS